jgi:hypothetical protein
MGQLAALARSLHLAAAVATKEDLVRNSVVVSVGVVGVATNPSRVPLLGLKQGQPGAGSCCFARSTANPIGVEIACREAKTYRHIVPNCFV